MATTKNTNLFYQLYSNNNTVAQSGYVCSSAINENDTSFDISGSEALITDSNGNVLASIDFSSIHAAGITQYNVETRILQPKSAYLLLGNEYGETYKALFFLINSEISKIDNYNSYSNILFDILYKQNNKVCNIHVNTKTVRETYGSFTVIVQNQLNKLKVPITITIRTLEDENSSYSTLDYITFQSTEEGYDFIVRNVILTPIMLNDENCNGDIGEFMDSPFVEPIVTLDLIIELLDKYQPKYKGEKNNSESNDNNYKINCDIYRTLLTLGNDITDDFNTFCYELSIIEKHFLPCFDIYGNLVFPRKFNELVIVKYPEIYRKYFSGNLEKYNPHDIFEILNDIKDYIFSGKAGQGPVYCYEEIKKRISNVKYPNGALRGIVIIPDWPNDDYETSVLWLNHVADNVEICVPVEIKTLREYFGGNIISNKKARLFEKAFATVKINALIPSEKQQYIEDYENLPLNDISSNDGFTTSFDNLQIAGFDNNDYINNKFQRVPLSQDKYDWDERIKYHDKDLYIDENKDDENIWENNPNKNNIRNIDTHSNISEKYIGLYKYMEYLSTNDLWLRIGETYMIIGKDDNFEKDTKNLLQSILIYNPNDVPIRIKYIIFS